MPPKPESEPDISCIRHPDAIAWDYWLISDGASCADPISLKAPAQQRQYLQNRLAKAFQAGIDHGRKCPNP